MKIINILCLCALGFVFYQYKVLEENYIALHKDYDEWVPNSVHRETAVQHSKTAYISGCVMEKNKEGNPSYGENMKYCIKKSEAFVADTRDILGMK